MVLWANLEARSRPKMGTDLSSRCFSFFGGGDFFVLFLGGIYLCLFWGGLFSFFFWWGGGGANCFCGSGGD